MVYKDEEVVLCTMLTRTKEGYIEGHPHYIQWRSTFEILDLVLSDTKERWTHPFVLGSSTPDEVVGRRTSFPCTYSQRPVECYPFSILIIYLETPTFSHSKVLTNNSVVLNKVGLTVFLRISNKHKNYYTSVPSFRLLG